MVASSPDVAGTDPDVRREIVGTASKTALDVATEAMRGTNEIQRLVIARGLLARARSA